MSESQPWVFHRRVALLRNGAGLVAGYLRATVLGHPDLNGDRSEDIAVALDVIWEPSTRPRFTDYCIPFDLFEDDIGRGVINFDGDQFLISWVEEPVLPEGLLEMWADNFPKR